MRNGPGKEAGGWSARKGKDEHPLSRKTDHVEEGCSQVPPSNAICLLAVPSSEKPPSHVHCLFSHIVGEGGVIFPHPLRAKLCPTQPVHPGPTSQFSMLPHLPTRGRMFSRINIPKSISWYTVSVPVARPVFLFLQTLPQPRDSCMEPFPTPLSVRPREQLALDLGRNTDTMETRKMQKPLPGPGHRLFPWT